MVRKMVLAGLIGLLAAFAAGSYPAVHANGVPQLVKLTYLEGVSNFGPADAEGVLEFSFAEAYARIEVKNLKPAAGVTFEGWLTGGDGQPFLVGKIPVQPSGVATVETKLDGLSRFDYNLFVVAARAENAAPGTIPAQKSIAGRFTVIDSPNSAKAAGDARPRTLPETGQAEPGTEWGRIFRTIAVTGGVALAAFGVLRTIRRRRESR